MKSTIKFVFEDGYVYEDTDEIKYSEILTSDPFGEPTIDSMSVQAYMGYVCHMGWAEDFESITKAEKLLSEVLVDDKKVY